MTLMKQHTKTNKMICLSICGCLGLKLELGLGEEPWGSLVSPKGFGSNQRVDGHLKRSYSSLCSAAMLARVPFAGAQLGSVLSSVWLHWWVVWAQFCVAWFPVVHTLAAWSSWRSESPFWFWPVTQDRRTAGTAKLKVQFRLRGMLNEARAIHFAAG